LDYRTLVEERQVEVIDVVADDDVQLRRPQSYVSKYERGDRRLDVIEFLEIALAGGFDPGEILSKLPL
jgi:hypothetical protein